MSYIWRSHGSPDTQTDVVEVAGATSAGDEVMIELYKSQPGWFDRRAETEKRDMASLLNDPKLERLLDRLHAQSDAEIEKCALFQQQLPTGV